jgi:hypothetical protein
MDDTLLIVLLSLYGGITLILFIFVILACKINYTPIIEN